MRRGTQITWGNPEENTLSQRLNSLYLLTSRFQLQVSVSSYCLTSDVPLGPRLDDAFIALLIDLDLDVRALNYGVRLHKLPLHLWSRHDDLTPLCIHAVDSAKGFVEASARGYIGGAAPDVKTTEILCQGWFAVSVDLG